MKDAFIVDGIRTPIGKYGGALSGVRADDLAAAPLAEVLKRNSSVDPAQIADVVLGCANQAGEDNRNISRMALLLAGLPPQVPGETVNRLCASGLSAVLNAGRCIQLAEGDFYLAGGVEQMSRAPYVMAKPTQAFSRAPEVFDTTMGWRFVNERMMSAWGIDSMGETAENLVDGCAIARADQDAFSLRSQQKAAAAIKSGRLALEIMPLSVPQRGGTTSTVSTDEFPRPETTLEALSALRPAFRKNGTVTAGNSSGINDGAAALLLASEAGLKSAGLTPLARIVASAAVGVEPRIMGIGPVEAVRRVLSRAGLTLDRIDLIELNEAFAAQSLAVLRQLGIADDDERVNPNGGAIALGHPLGMSGARLALTAARELEKTGKRYALVTMCVGVGQGVAAVLEQA